MFQNATTSPAFEFNATIFSKFPVTVGGNGADVPGALAVGTAYATQEAGAFLLLNSCFQLLSQGDTLWVTACGPRVRAAASSGLPSRGNASAALV